MRIQIPRFSDPTIRTYLDYAFIFSIRDGSTAYEHFLLSHYGGLCFLHSFYKDAWDPFDLFPAPRMPQLSSSGLVTAVGHSLWRSVDGDSINPISSIHNQIAQGHSCYVALDYFWLPGRQEYRNRHLIHHCLITGIDLDNKSVELLGYLRDGMSDFGARWVPIKVFLRALAFDPNDFRNEIEKPFCMWWYRYFETYNISSETIYCYNKSMFLEQLRQYQTSSCTSRDLDRHNRDLSAKNACFGISVYDSLEEWTRRFKTDTVKSKLHVPRLFWEHKRFMLERFLFFSRGDENIINENDIELMKMIVKSALFFRIAAFEAYVTSSSLKIDQMMNSLLECCELEQRCYSEICDRF